jgi:hypothetical protein
MKSLSDHEVKEASLALLRIVESKAWPLVQVMLTDELATDMLNASNTQEREDCAKEYSLLTRFFDSVTTIANSVRGTM